MRALPGMRVPYRKLTSSGGLAFRPDPPIAAFGDVQQLLQRIVQLLPWHFGNGADQLM
jgi:hypothetical protein